MPYGPLNWRPALSTLMIAVVLISPGCEDLKTEPWRYVRLNGVPRGTFLCVLFSSHTRTRRCLAWGDPSIAGRIRREPCESGSAYLSPDQTGFEAVVENVPAGSYGAILIDRTSMVRIVELKLRSPTTQSNATDLDVVSMGPGVFLADVREWPIGFDPEQIMERLTHIHSNTMSNDALTDYIVSITGVLSKPDVMASPERRARPVVELREAVLEKACVQNRKLVAPGPAAVSLLSDLIEFEDRNASLSLTEAQARWNRIRERIEVLLRDRPSQSQR